MSVLRDIERAIGQGMHYLCSPRYWPGGIANLEALKDETELAQKEKRQVRLQPICHSTDQARRILRVEIGYDAQTEIWSDPDCPWRYDGPDFQGARRLRGVDTYVVDRLLAPGWRVINPMAEAQQEMNRMGRERPAWSVHGWEFNAKGEIIVMMVRSVEVKPEEDA